MHLTPAWILQAGDETHPSPGQLEFGEIPLSALEPDEALVEPLYAGWEGNCFHAVQRQPIDVCRARGESRVVLGNSGVVRVLRPPASSQPENLREGDVCLVQPNYRPDAFGYGMNGSAFGYDAAGTVGLLAKRTKIRANCLIPLPSHTRHSLEQWAAFSIRYVTAFANWRIAYGTWRLQVTEQDQTAPYVWGWGGGTTFAELTLAAIQGAEATIVTSRDRRITLAKAHGLSAVDRRQFPDLSYDEQRAHEPDYAERYRSSEKLFLQNVHESTHGMGASIFIDYLGGSMLRPTLKALARAGVVTTAGWREGPRTTYIRAIECIERHQHIHTHYARRSEVLAAMEFGESHGWMPPTEAIAQPWPYESVPNLVATYASGDLDAYFPLVRVNQ
jgi:NADPH:quinone reductase-like Zn-dependent oxidoreductase